MHLILNNGLRVDLKIENEKDDRPTWIGREDSGGEWWVEYLPVTWGLPDPLESSQVSHDNETHAPLHHLPQLAQPQLMPSEKEHAGASGLP